MKVGLFGGSFNPVHNSHVKVVRDVLDRGVVDKVLVIPCYLHPFGKKFADFDYRVDMLELAFEDVKNVEVSDIERQLGRTSLTYNTVTALKKRFDHEFYWMLGGDCVKDFDEWELGEELSRELEFIVYDREGFVGGDSSLMRVYDRLDVAVDNISSTNVRERVKGGLSVEDLLPGKVVEYVDRRGLYLE